MSQPSAASSKGGRGKGIAKGYATHEERTMYEHVVFVFAGLPADWLARRDPQFRAPNVLPQPRRRGGRQTLKASRNNLSCPPHVINVRELLDGMHVVR